MPVLNTKPQEIRIPEAIVLPDGRKRITRYFRVVHTAMIPPELALPWGTLDPADSQAPDDWKGLRLTNRKVYDTHRFIKDDDKHGIIEMVYETIDESEETPVGEDDTTFLEDGRKAIVQSFLQFTTGTYAPQAVGSAHAAGYLMKEEAPDDGTLRRIKRTYVAAGLLRQTDETRNGGALLIRSLTYAVTVPSTPSGYSLFDVEQVNPAGYPVYTYKFAKGSGTISTVTTGESDGALVYVVTDAGASAATPTYPGTGTAYLTMLSQMANDGHWINVARYVKPPADQTLKKSVEVPLPGVAYFLDTQLVLQPPTRPLLLCDVHVTYGTSQDTSTPFTVLQGSSFYDAYTIAATGQVVNHSQGLGDYLSEGFSSGGSDALYNGVECSVFTYATAESDPPDLPTGETVLHVTNDPYLTALDGTVVFRRTVTKYTF